MSDSPAPEAGADARSLLSRYGLRPKKSWGQNFLVDRAAQTRIVEAALLGRDDVAVEIGAGLGAITQGLAAQARNVIAVERDPDLVRVLETEFQGRDSVRIVALDAVDFDFGRTASQAGRPLVVVGNLPYQITSPLLFKIVESADRGKAVARAVLMVQREFAERMAAKPGSKIYGRLSVMVQQQAEVEVLFHVGAHSFHPRPTVTSTVFRLTPRPVPWAAVADERVFAEVVRAAFGARRKMLRRALSPSFGNVKAEEALAQAGIEGTRRGEELAVADFARIANALAERGASSGA